MGARPICGADRLIPSILEYNHRRIQDFCCVGVTHGHDVILRFGVLNGMRSGRGDKPAPENI